jgi:hypothetical protein
MADEQNGKIGLILGGLGDEPPESQEPDDDEAAYSESVAALVEAFNSGDVDEVGRALRAAIALAQ